MTWADIPHRFHRFNDLFISEFNFQHWELSDWGVRYFGESGLNLISCNSPDVIIGAIEANKNSPSDWRKIFATFRTVTLGSIFSHWRSLAKEGCFLKINFVTDGIWSSEATYMDHLLNRTNFVDSFCQLKNPIIANGGVDVLDIGSGFGWSW